MTSQTEFMGSFAHKHRNTKHINLSGLTFKQTLITDPSPSVCVCVWLSLMKVMSSVSKIKLLSSRNKQHAAQSTHTKTLTHQVCSKFIYFCIYLFLRFSLLYFRDSSSLKNANLSLLKFSLQAFKEVNVKDCHCQHSRAHSEP